MPLPSPEAVWPPSLNNSFGLYLHVPFCESKCAYCDFYSYRADVRLYEQYTDRLCEHLKTAGQILARRADTLYFGGGTPSLLGGKRIARLVSAAKSAFGLENAEITVESNPADDLKSEFEIMAESGVNRFSLGVQSAIESELKILSRRHTNADVLQTVGDARAAGINNISLDLMLGIPKQTTESLKRSVDFVAQMLPNHISCYILKTEPNTPFGRKNPEQLGLPDDDTVADMYLYMSSLLKEYGFEHYEISNFAKPGFRSRHNSGYWKCREYLGLGPASHSFVNGKRFFFERDTEKYLTSPTFINDGDGGDFEEYCMLNLRLSDGIDIELLKEKFDEQPLLRLLKKAEKLSSTETVETSDGKVKLTEKGFLVSNAVISELLF